jgi:RNase H-fold protein (predicted Holliday junction resolvase)
MHNEKTITPTKTTLLALRPGRRKVGVAVLEGQDLLFWGVAGFREYRGEELLKAVEGRLLALIQTYQPQVLAVEKPAPARLAASPALGAVLDRISAVVVRERLRVRLYHPLTE